MSNSWSLSSLGRKTFPLLGSPGPLANAGWARAGAAILVALYLVVTTASYAASSKPESLSMHLGRCNGTPCIIWVMPVSTAWDDGVRPGATLLSLNGVPTPDVDQAPPSITSLRVRSSSGDVISVSVVDELVTEGRVKFSLWLLGALFAVLGSAVLLRRPDLNSARWFAGFAGAAAVALAIGPASAGPAPPWALIVQFFSLIGIGFTCLPFVATLVLDGYRPRKSRLVRGIRRCGGGTNLGLWLLRDPAPRRLRVRAPGILALRWQDLS